MAEQPRRRRSLLADLRPLRESAWPGPDSGRRPRACVTCAARPSPQTLGLLSTALAAGGLLGSVPSGPAGRVAANARATLVTVVIWGAAITCFGFARVFWLDIVGAGVPRLGNFEAGAIAPVTSPGFSAVSGGVATMVGALLIRLAFPAVARYRAPVELPSAADAPGPAHTEVPGEEQQAKP